MMLDPFGLTGAAAPRSAHDADRDVSHDAAFLAAALIPRHPTVSKAERVRKASAGTAPNAGAMQLLGTALAHWPVHFAWSQIAALNGHKARGGHFNTCRKLLVDGGLVTERDGQIEPTDAAFARLGTVRKTKPQTRDKILDMWLTALPSPAKDILREVAARPGVAVIEDVAGRLGLAPRGGYWNTGVRLLRVNDLVRTSLAGFELGQALAGISMKLP